MKKLITLIIALLGLITTNIAQTSLPGLISTDQTWGPSGSPYTFFGSLVIDSGVTITILPGAIVKSNGNRMYVNGSIEAIGTKTSKIQIDSIQMIFSTKSKDYDSATQKGCQFNYCIFNGTNYRRWSNINSASTDLIIINSEFYNGSIVLGGKATIDNCLFDNSNSLNQKIGTPLSASKTSYSVTNSVFNYFNSLSVYGNGINTGNIFKNFNTIGASGVLENNTFDSFSSISASGQFDFKNNKFSHFNNFSFYPEDLCNIECNSFVNGQQGIAISMGWRSNPATGIIFENNTLDSMGGNEAMVSYFFRYGDRFKLNTRFNNNNFLNRTGTVEKIIFNSDYTKGSKPINTKSNYWGTTDSATIESFIKDLADDPSILYRADISTFATNQIISNCASTLKPCKANFSYTLDQDTAIFVDSSTAANGYIRTWIYGDGSTGGHSFKKHAYNPGIYNACLAIRDTITGCKDTFCQTITISSCEASYYFGKDTGNKFKITVFDDSKGITSTTQFLWDFGDGNTSTSRKPTHTYAQFKKYYLCLTLLDSAKNCYSTFCDSVGMDSLGKLRRSGGFTINILDKNTSISSAEELELNIYPNPSTGKVYFNLEEEIKNGASVTVLNPIGKTVFSETENKNGSIDLKDLPNGMYFIHIHTEYKSGVARVLLNK